MKVSARFDIIDKIGREMQDRFKFDQIDPYLQNFGVGPVYNFPVNSKWAYVKAALAGASLDVIARIADDLDMGGLAHISAQASPPANWRGTENFRLFISHISANKAHATRLKKCLSPYSISGFVAHEDIHPTLEWQSEIERALWTMDAFIAVHTPGFSKSIWTQQEVGFALGRGVKVISFKMGEDPTGFISKRQALARQNRTAEQVASEVDRLLSEDPMTAPRLLQAKRPPPASMNSDDEIPF